MLGEPSYAASFSLDVIVGKYDRTAETSRMICAVAIHEDGRYTELDLSNKVDMPSGRQ